MGELVAVSGNTAAAEAMRQINPDVVAAYPITPSTEIMQVFSEFVADGRVHTNMVAAESEHSAMSACIGAAAAGGRVMNATSANGLALMWEMLYIASGTRLPIILSVVNRALSAPLNIHGDHSDAYGARDSGWIQFFSENAQEQYDNTIQAVPISEHMDIRLPVMISMDGFIISHSIESMEFLPDEAVRGHIGDYKPNLPLLDTDNPVTYGPADLQNYYMEHKWQQSQAIRNSIPIILEEAERFKKLSGREYGLFEAVELEDAELVLVAMGSTAGTIKALIKDLRGRGIKAGLLKPRLFRPFPFKEVARALEGAGMIVCLDRADSFGAQGGALFGEVRSALYGAARPPEVVNRIYGLGGRDLKPADLDREVVAPALARMDGGAELPEFDYITVRK